MNVKEKSSCTYVFEIQCQDSSSRWVCVADLYPTTSIQSWYCPSEMFSFGRSEIKMKKLEK